MPGTGIEPVHLAVPDFKSGVSTDFTTRAGRRIVPFAVRIVRNKSAQLPEFAYKTQQTENNQHKLTVNNQCVELC